MSPRVRTLLVWFVLVVAAVAIYTVVADDDASLPHQSGATFFSDMTSGSLRRIEVDDQQRLYAIRTDGSEYAVDLPFSETVDESARAMGVAVEWRREETSPWLFVGVVVAVVALVVVLSLRRMRAQGTNILTLRRTTARLVADTPKIGWDDVGGAAEAKAYLRDTVDFLKAPARWEAAGARPPRGVLLEGPPGYGKTLLAKALAGEAKLPFFEVSGAEFVELFVGVGAARVRDLFDEAKKKAPCVVFIDEIDAIGRKRGGAGAGLMHQEREQALDQLLVSLDGFSPRSRVVVIAATNRADVLDPALLRPGRFDVTLRVGDFTATDRRAILDVHTRNKPIGRDVDLDAIAARLTEASGADLEQLCNAAAMSAVRRGGTPVEVGIEDFEKAIASHAPKSTQLDKLDSFLAQASSGIAQPTSALTVSIRLESGDSHRGAVLWADPLWLKLKTDAGTMVFNRDRIVAIAADGSVEAIGSHDLLRVAPAPAPDAS